MIAAMASKIPRTEWQSISEQLQLSLAQAAMRQASTIIADQAELFAVQFTTRTLHDPRRRRCAETVRRTAAGDFGRMLAAGG
ncbi:MAG: hypothetical protein WDN04_11765 [Rhodospirillales bacterium]